MSDTDPDETVASGCVNLRQGDVIDLDAIVLARQKGEMPDVLPTPQGVVLLSQTCDVVQQSKTRCLVAPVIDADSKNLSDAKKGRKPLHLYLGNSDVGTKPCVADIERAASVPKEALVGKKLLARYTRHPSGSEVGAIAARIGRAFTRFPFPDEVYSVFGELRARAQSRAGTPSPFGQVIDVVLDIRVSADQWTSPQRRLVVFVVVPEALISPPDDIDDGWSWGPARVVGCRAGEQLANLDLNRACELILLNQKGDLTTLTRLWLAFADRLRTEVFPAHPGDAVASVAIEVLSEVELTYQQYRKTESLDLEALSLTSR